jgi:hypothetical protein
MTMYLPNDDVRPTGYEAGEFLDVPPEADEPAGPQPWDGPAAIDDPDDLEVS